MAKKRGLAANRGLDALLGSIKKEKQITAAALRDDSLASFDVDDQALADNETAQEGCLLASQQTKSSKSTLPRTANTKPLNVDSQSHQSSTSESRAVDSSKAGTLKNGKASRKTTGNPKTTPISNGLEDQISLVQIDLERLQAGKYQPRRDMSEAALTELAASIEQHGIMQPIVIRPLLDKEDKTHAKVTHEIIAGERRWRAAKMAGMKVIPAIERALSDELAIALALIENIQREDLSVIEQAAALQRFHTEFGMSHAMIADVVGKARTTVSNLLRLNQLHDTVKDHLANNELDMGHARTLLPLSLPQQPIIAQKIIDGNLTVREAEKLVKSILNPAPKVDKEEQSLHRDIERLNQQLSDALGATVKLKHKKGGKGSVEIFFHSEEELEALIKHLNV